MSVVEVKAEPDRVSLENPATDHRQPWRDSPALLSVLASPKPAVRNNSLAAGSESLGTPESAGRYSNLGALRIGGNWRPLPFGGWTVTAG